MDKNEDMLILLLTSGKTKHIYELYETYKHRQIGV